MFAVSKHRDAVGNLKRFFQSVRDVDDRHPKPGQASNEREEVSLLLRGEGSGRLVENHNTRVRTHRPGDLDHLSLRRTERGHVMRGIDRKIQRLKKLLGRDVDASQPVERLFRTKIQILCDRHRRYQAGFLEHHGDTASHGIGGRGKRHFGAVQDDLARGGLHDAGNDFGQGRLACAILPHNGMHFPWKKIEVDVLDGGVASILLCNVFQLEQGHHVSSLAERRGR